MKKFYAIVAAALMSVSLFATAPSAADLASYAKDGHYVACFSTPAEGTCNDIVWIGTYDGWNADDPDKIVCEPLSGFDGWYVAVVPITFKEDGVTPDCCGKPVQLDECGDFDWANQCGRYGSIEVVSGSVDIQKGGGYGDGLNESDLKDWSTTEPTIIDMTEWKSSPCAKTCSKVRYSIRLFDPYCAEHSEFQPYLRGSFNNWGLPVAMEMKDTIVDGEEASVWVYLTKPCGDNLEFQWNNHPTEKDNWDNRFQYYDDDEDKWLNLGESNFKLDPEDKWSKFYTRTGNTLEFDLSDDTKFRYAKCDEEPDDPADLVDHKVFVKLWAPEGTPAAGPEIIGSFNNWLNEPAGPQVILTLVDGLLGPYYDGVIAAAKGKDEFKIREANNWSNEIKMIVSEEQQNFQPKFKDVWVDADGLIEGAAADDKALLLDLTSGFAWLVPQGIEDIVLTEKAQKVMVDGVLYIVRDNKMFNVQGAQVR